jgi:hypothetical protein
MPSEEQFADDKRRKKIEDISHRCVQMDTDKTMRNGQDVLPQVGLH